MPYISNNQGYTYGVKTLSEIDSITGMVQGETVWCSDNYKIITYNGETWMCSDFIMLNNDSGVTLVRGDVVVVSATTANSCDVTTTLDDPTVIGAVVFGGADSTNVSIAFQGIYDVKMAAAVGVGDEISADNTAEQAYVSGMAAGFFAIALEDTGGAGLARCIIVGKLEYF